MDVYIVVPDYEYDGYGEPVSVHYTEDEAIAKIQELREGAVYAQLYDYFKLRLE